MSCHVHTGPHQRSFEDQEHCHVPKRARGVVQGNVVFVRRVGQRCDVSKDIVVVPLWRHMQPMQMNIRVVGSRIDFPVVQPIPGKVFCYGVGVVLADRRFRFVPQCVDQGQKHFVASFDP